MMKRFLNDYKEKFNDNLNANDNLSKIKASLSFDKEDEYYIENEPKKPKRSFKWAYASIIMALIVIVASITTVLLVNNNGVPVYKGMDILNNTLLSLDNTQIDEEIDNDMPDIIADDNISSYAKPLEEIVIRIKIDNPKDYEILSFTLNDYKYQSFEFLEGSTGKEILVKYKAPEASGLHNITINSLKYVDENKIKECNYAGNRTIKLGVSYLTLPSIEVLAEDVYETSYSFTYELHNVDNLAELNGRTKYYLFSDEGLVIQGELANNIDRIKLDNLKMDSSYSFSIATTMDTLDGRGFRTYYLYQREFKTLSGVKINSIDARANELRVDAIARDGVEIKAGRLYIGDELYMEALGNNISFTNIYSNTDYILEIEYSYELNGQIIIGCYRERVRTSGYEEPQVTGNVLAIKNGIYLDFDIVGALDTVIDTNIDIYLDDVYFKSTKELKGMVTIDKKFTNVRVSITIKYDLNDGNGVQEKVFRSFSEAF